MTSRIKIMADCCSTGIWDEESHKGLDPKELGLSEATCQALAAWVAFYDTNCEDWRPREDRTGSFDYAAFTLQGKKIAEQLKGDRPDLTVFYFDEEKLQVDLARQNRTGSKTYLIEV